MCARFCVLVPVPRHVLAAPHVYSSFESVVQETVDELRAEMASTRAAVKLYKERQQVLKQQTKSV